ncbi:MAG: hypothetical protein LUQ32_07035 [Methanomicrobiales archaeon]|nr:hypothetical protein [Methanomicrobiales archaeon]
MPILLLLVTLPCLIGLIGGFSLVTVLGFIISILVLQGLAAAAGIGLGIPPFLLIPLMVSPQFRSLWLLHPLWTLLGDSLRSPPPLRRPPARIGLFWDA